MVSLVSQRLASLAAEIEAHMEEERARMQETISRLEVERMQAQMSCLRLERQLEEALGQLQEAHAHGKELEERLASHEHGQKEIRGTVAIKRLVAVQRLYRHANATHAPLHMQWTRKDDGNSMTVVATCAGG
jgi:chromosome segregation ATPase